MAYGPLVRFGCRVWRRMRPRRAPALWLFVELAWSFTLPIVTGHVFISYSRRDGEYVARLAAFLRERDVPLWLDDQIDLGTRWTTVIQGQIETCAAFVLIMTPEAATSDWVTREIHYAQTLSKPIVPLLLKGQPFFHVLDVQHEDVTGERLPGPRLVERLRQLTAAAMSSGVVTSPRVVMLAARVAPSATNRPDDRRPRWLRRGSVAVGSHSTVFGQRLQAGSVVVLALLIGYLITAIAAGINLAAGGDRDTAPALIALWILATLGGAAGLRWGLRRTLTLSAAGITYRPILRTMIRRPLPPISWPSVDLVEVNDGRLITVAGSERRTVCRLAWLGVTHSQLTEAIARFQPRAAPP